MEKFCQIWSHWCLRLIRTSIYNGRSRRAFDLHRDRSQLFRYTSNQKKVFNFFSIRLTFGPFNDYTFLTVTCCWWCSNTVAICPAERCNKSLFASWSLFNECLTQKYESHKCVMLKIKQSLWLQKLVCFVVLFLLQRAIPGLFFIISIISTDNSKTCSG